MAPKGRKPGGRAKSSPGEADATAAAAPAGGAEGSPIAAASVEEGSAKKRKLLQLTGADEEMEDAFQSQVLTGAADEATEGDAGEAKEKKDKKDKKEKKEKKEKKDKGEKADKDEEEAGEESATEYPDCDLAATPERLHVRNSGHSKIDGEYRRLDKPSRGRPAYSMQREGKKPLYLFWYKSNKWLISLVLGAHKNLARVDDSGVEGRRQPPCEPYPHAWKVMAEESSKEKSKDNKEKEKRSYQVAQPMRVIDSATLDGAGEDFLGAEPDASGDSRKKARKGSKSAVDASSGASGSEATGSTAGDKAADAAKGDGKAESKAADAKGRDADAEMIANMAGGDSDSDDEDDEAAKPEGAKSDKESDSGSSDSDSDSGQSSSSAPASPQKPKAAAPAASAAPGSASPGGTAATAAAAQPKAGPAAPQAAPEEQERKRQAFVGKLRTQLENIKDPKQRHQKLQQVRAMLNERADHLQKVAGMNPSEVKALTDSLERDFGPRGGKRMPLVRGKGQPDGASGGQAAPSTPPEQRYAGDGGGAPPHRLPLAAKSAIKGKNGNRFKGKTPRITWPHTNSTHTVPVECFRGLGEQLWFHMPGAYVVCDNCEKSVPQSMGALQGEPQRPQFAQCQFLCSECMAQQMAGQQLNMGYQQ